MAKIIEYNAPGKQIAFSIFGDTKKEVLKAKDDYLGNYNPAGYDTRLNMTDPAFNELTEKYYINGTRLQSAD